MEHTAVKQLTLRLERQAGLNAIAISIEDTGCGIAPDNIKKIFDPYFTTRADLGGTGLGLHIVKHIVESHGASISAESRVGVGSTFLITFPDAVAKCGLTAQISTN
jgi:two-component system NtrC family sensor kinase